jgi:hypothetical protein
MSPSPLEGVQNVEEVYALAKDLDTVYEHKTKEDISALLKTHFLGEEEETPSVPHHDDEDEVFTPTPVAKAVVSDEEELAEAKAQDAAIQDILKDL